VQDVQPKKYGRSLSTVFGSSEKKYSAMYEDDDDPILDELRILDYRYIRFSFHPPTDKFVLCNSWTDPMWTDIKSIRAGIDGDEKDIRELVFGKNLIDIEQKSIAQLLVDEVGSSRYISRPKSKIFQGISPLLRLPDRKSNPLVGGRILLLCRMHSSYISRQHYYYTY
jgi:cation-transporting ATPase 13A2